MSIDQQIDKLKGHSRILSQEFRDLIESFSMLLPMNENQDLICRVSKTKRARGFEILRWNLTQQCIIGINKLVYDTGARNPTAGNLIELFLNAPEGMRDKLKAVFSVPIKSDPLIYISEEEEKEQAAVWEEIEKIEIRELQKIFDACLPKLNQSSVFLQLLHPICFNTIRDVRTILERLMASLPSVLHDFVDSFHRPEPLTDLWRKGENFLAHSN
jgi:hypothetical protein